MFRLIEWIMKNVPWLSRVLEKNDTLVMSIVAGCIEREDYPRALELCMQSLRNGSGKAGVAKTAWNWLQLKYAVECAKKLDRTDLRAELIRFAENAPPLTPGSREASNIFIMLSRWSFEAKDLEKMLSLSKRAVAADETWGYPCFLLGWYGLFVEERIDSIKYFTKAIELDPSVRDEIRKDDLCIKNKETLAIFFN